MRFTVMLIYFVIYLIVILSLVGLPFMAGLGLIGISADVLDPMILIEHLETNILDTVYGRILLCFAGLSIIASALLGFIRGITARPRREKTIRFDTDSGQVKITMTALEDVVKKSLEEEEIISHIKPRITSLKKGIVINVKLVLKTETNIKDFAEDIQEKIKEKLQSILGKEKDLKINIEVKKMAFSKKAHILEDEIEDSEGPFRKY